MTHRTLYVSLACIAAVVAACTITLQGRVENSPIGTFEGKLEIKLGNQGTPVPTSPPDQVGEGVEVETGKPVVLLDTDGDGKADHAAEKGGQTMFPIVSMTPRRVHAQAQPSWLVTAYQNPIPGFVPSTFAASAPAYNATFGFSQITTNGVHTLNNVVLHAATPNPGDPLASRVILGVRLSTLVWPQFADPREHRAVQFELEYLAPPRPDQGHWFLNLTLAGTVRDVAMFLGRSGYQEMTFTGTMGTWMYTGQGAPAGTMNVLLNGVSLGVVKLW